MRQAVSLAIVCAVAVAPAYAQPAAVVAPADPPAAKAPTAVEPKPLSENVNKALAWLIKNQHADGSWSQGDESTAMGGGAGLRDTPDVADTCVAALALLRSGSTPTAGPYAANLRSAIEFVTKQVAASDEKSLYITDIRNTRVQLKLGPYIDTFMASMLLAQVRKQMPDDSSTHSVATAFDKVMDKIEKNQKEDGTWDNRGWAPVLSQSMASKALNLAAQNGRHGNELVRMRAEQYARSQYDAKSGNFGGGGSAGVGLYGAAGPVGAMQASDQTNQTQAAAAREVLKTSKDETRRKEATATIARADDNRRDLEGAQKAVLAKMEDQKFMSGFGSNGGEEYLSHMNIGESLIQKGGDDWKKWDKSMTENLNRIQNDDGSWTGHHCITGRTFCTAAALMVLTVDRSTIPVAAKIGKRGKNLL